MLSPIYISNLAIHKITAASDNNLKRGKNSWTNLGFTTLSRTTFSIMTLSIMTLSMKAYIVTLSINEIRHK